MRRVRKAQLMLAVKLVVGSFIVLHAILWLTGEREAVREAFFLVTRARQSTNQSAAVSSTTAEVAPPERELDAESIRRLEELLAPHSVARCDGQVQIYGDKFARLHHVVLHTGQATGPSGGEPYTEVLNRPEQLEYPTLQSGFLQLNCNDSNMPLQLSSTRGPVKRYLPFLQLGQSMPTPTAFNNRTTLLLTRIEYANLCHTTTYFYNVYVTARFLQLPLDSMQVLIMDAHAAGNLDDTWRVLFGDMVRLGALAKPQTIFYSDLLLPPDGYDSALLSHRVPQAPPLLEDFREFVLRRYGVTPRTLNCSKLAVTFVWRHDYVAHPRNPTGRLTRKISNEGELLLAAQNDPRFYVLGVQLDALSVQQQLQIVAHTDVLVGMHGAALTHVLFVPPHAALIELYPRRYRVSPRFNSMTRWRALRHLVWQSSEQQQTDEWTRVPPNEIMDRLNSLHSQMCP